MTYSFTSAIDMLAFFNGMSDSTDYSVLLKDFGIDSTEGTTLAQRKYMFRYLVQGQFKGLEGMALIQYAVDGVAKFHNSFPWVITSTNEQEAAVSVAEVAVPVVAMEVPEVVQSGRGRKRTNFAQAGQIVYNKDYDRYYGYGENYAMIASSNDLKKLQEKMKNKFGYDAVLVS